MEIPLEKVFIAQKFMIRMCNLAGKPVITATQMLESMISNPRPTRAECSDVVNAVLDGTDCVMLSGETANGQFPFEAVATMARCCKEAELMVDFSGTFNNMRAAQVSMSRQESLASSAVKTGEEMKCPLILVVSQSGRTARYVSKYFPRVPISVITDDARVARQCSGYVRNCHSSVVGNIGEVEEIMAATIHSYLKTGWVKVGDPIILVFGNRSGSGSTDMIKLIYVQE